MLNKTISESLIYGVFQTLLGRFYIAKAKLGAYNVSQALLGHLYVIKAKLKLDGVF